MSLLAAYAKWKTRHRKISFEENVEIVTIPSCDSLDEETKRSMWYTQEEFYYMRRCMIEERTEQYCVEDL